MLRAYTRAGYWLRARLCGADGGDVPGWVMVTMMTAVIVVALMGVAKTKLEDLFQSAIAQVHP